MQPPRAISGRQARRFCGTQLGELLTANAELVTLNLCEGELHGERTIAAQRYTVGQCETFLASWAESRCQAAGNGAGQGPLRALTSSKKALFSALSIDQSGGAV